METGWNKCQSEVLSVLQAQELVLCGDGRCDSPGTSAKYCTYTLMESNTNLIVHSETVTKAEVGF